MTKAPNPEVAFELLVAIATAEDRCTIAAGKPVFRENTDKQWILDTYRDCLTATLGDTGGGWKKATPQ